MELFRDIDESMGVLDRRQTDFINNYSLVNDNLFGLTRLRGLAGRPFLCRRSVLKLLFMKACLSTPTTKAARSFVKSSCFWRRICGFESPREVLSEAILSRAFAEFSHDGAIASNHRGVIVRSIVGPGHLTGFGAERLEKLEKGVIVMTFIKDMMLSTTNHQPLSW